ncbi:MAG: hemolysin family protein [Actinomycetota bacterium]
MIEAPPTVLIPVAMTLLIVAAVFAAVETSLSRISRVRAAQLVDDGRRGSAALMTLAADPAPVLSVVTFARVVGEAFAAVVVTVIVIGLVEGTWAALSVAAAVMALLSFVVVGVSPRTLGRQHAERLALLTAPMVLTLMRVLGPLARLLVALGNAVTPGKGLPDGPFSTEAELRELLDLAGENAVLEASERRMLTSVIELGDTVVREVMVPRTQMITIDADRTVRQALSLFLRSGFSRIPVVDGDPDELLGILYLKDVTRTAFRDGSDGQASVVTTVMRPPVFVPETKPVDDLLRQMQREQNHVALVVDEYGGIAGLVTIEDVLEEIVGEITDEYDREVAPVEELTDGSFRVRASLPVDELGALFDMALDDDEVDTVGGLLAKLIGRVPIPGASARIDGLELTAERLAGRRHRIATVVARDLRHVIARDESQAIDRGTSGSDGEAAPMPAGGEE